jgi:hypothetical protein
MDGLSDRVNLGRRLYRDGDCMGAFAVFKQVAAAVDGRAVALENPAFADAVDAATMMALSLLDTGERGRARDLLEDLQPRLFPDLTDLRSVLDVVSDPEQRSMFVFGQLKLVELAADELDPPLRIIGLLRDLEPLAAAADNPLLGEYAAFLRARLKRLVGQWRQAADDWIFNGRRVDELAEAPRALPTGYPASRSLCEALLTIEAVDETSRVIDRLLAHGASADRWDATVLAGIRQRRAPAGATLPAVVGHDSELRRTAADAWFCGLATPGDRDVEALFAALTDAPLACRLCYPWRAARLTLQRTGAVPRALVHGLDELLAGLDDGLRRDYGLPPTAARLLRTPGACLARCTAI